MLLMWEGSITDANLLSRGGIHTQDDEDDYNGSAGEAKEKKLVLAPTQTTLAVGIDASITTITVNAPVFDDTNHPVKIIDDEKVYVTGGWGTNKYTVIRHWDGTTPTSHSSGAKIYDCYTYEDINIQASDESGSDETGWFAYAPDVSGSPGTYVSSLSPSDFTNPKTDSYTFWRRITVPASQAAQEKIDNRHKADFVPFEYSA